MGKSLAEAAAVKIDNALALATGENDPRVEGIPPKRVEQAYTS
jgi:hypothetical protein